MPSQPPCGSFVACTLLIEKLLLSGIGRAKCVARQSTKSVLTMMRGSGRVLEKVLPSGSTSASSRCLTASALDGVEGRDGSESCK